jgi:hypothetical protein
MACEKQLRQVVAQETPAKTEIDPLAGVILHECEEHLLTASAGRGEFLATERSAP